MILQDEPEPEPETLRRPGGLADELASSVATFVRSLDLGAPVVLEHFCLVPLLRALAPQQHDLSIRHDHLALLECEQRHPSRLRVVNRSGQPQLVLAGQLVRGGAQDRMLMESLVVPAHSAVEVAAICVERERWSGGDEAAMVQAFAPPSVRSHAFARDLMEEPHHASGGDGFVEQQEAVWVEVDRLSASVGDSPRSLADPRMLKKTTTHEHGVAEAHAGSSTWGDSCVGFAVVGDRGVVMLDAFSSPMGFSSWAHGLTWGALVEAVQKSPWRGGDAVWEVERVLQRFLVSTERTVAPSAPGSHKLVVDLGGHIANALLTARVDMDSPDVVHLGLSMCPLPPSSEGVVLLEGPMSKRAPR